MKRFAGIIAALGLFAVVLAGYKGAIKLDTEKPLPVIMERPSSTAMLAPVKGAPASPTHTQLAGFAAG